MTSGSPSRGSRAESLMNRRSRGRVGQMSDRTAAQATSARARATAVRASCSSARPRGGVHRLRHRRSRGSAPRTQARPSPRNSAYRDSSAPRPIAEPSARRPGLPDPAEPLAQERLDSLDRGRRGRAPRSLVGSSWRIPDSCTSPRSRAVVLVAASSSTRRIVSTSSAAARARAGRTPEPTPGGVALSSSGSRPGDNRLVVHFCGSEDHARCRT